MIPPARAGHGTFTTKHFLFRLQIKEISTWRRSYAFSTMIWSMDIRNPTPATISPKSNIILALNALPTPKAIDFKPGALLGSVSGELGLRKYLESNSPHFQLSPAIRTGPDQCLSASFPGRRCRDLATLLAGVCDGRADRQGREAEARQHRRHRLRPRRPSGRDRPRDYGRRWSPTAIRSASPNMADDDAQHRAELHSLLPMGGEGAAGTSPALRHARSMTSRACARRHGRRRPHRPCGASQAQALRHASALL